MDYSYRAQGAPTTRQSFADLIAHAINTGQTTSSAAAAASSSSSTPPTLQYPNDPSLSLQHVPGKQGGDGSQPSGGEGSLQDQ